MLVDAYREESKCKPIKIERKQTFEKSKESKTPDCRRRKSIKSEKTQYPYEIAEEIIEKSKNPGQRRKEFK